MSKQQTILVVDDCHSVRLAFQNILLESGYAAVLARNGKEALQSVTEDVAAIVLDINMPELDGFGFCEQLVQMGPAYQEIPVIILTNHFSEAVESLGNELGTCLSKPVSKEDMICAIESLTAHAGM